ncbi:MAG TPA: hypothetical protein VN376_00610, partial [Longilinea sp.]|nr:hypothetical protein [Longilinea sp.]
MKKVTYIFVLVAVLVSMAACQPAAATTTEAVETEAVVEAVPALTIVSGEQTIAFSLEDLQALPVSEGYGGIKSSTGRITAPELYTGVALSDLVAQLDGWDETMALELTAEDGYAMTYSYDQVMNGDFITYDPATGDELQQFDGTLTAILAYARNGEPLDANEEGTLRLIVISEENNQVTDGHWAVKWVNHAEIRPLAADWTLHLEGAITDDVDRGTFESAANPGCHQGEYTDDMAQTWVGIPLYYLVGRVDDDIRHEGDSFNDDILAAGYTVELVAADGYSITLDGATVAYNDNLILAYLVNDNPLNSEDFPLRLVGSDVTSE